MSKDLMDRVDFIRDQVAGYMEMHPEATEVEARMGIVVVHIIRLEEKVEKLEKTIEEVSNG